VTARLSQISSINSSRSSTLSERACLNTVLMSAFSAGSAPGRKNHQRPRSPAGSEQRERRSGALRCSALRGRSPRDFRRASRRQVIE
jgi:hypothetical protein